MAKYNFVTGEDWLRHVMEEVDRNLTEPLHASTAKPKRECSEERLCDLYKILAIRMAKDKGRAKQFKTLYL